MIILTVCNVSKDFKEKQKITSIFVDLEENCKICTININGL